MDNGTIERPPDTCEQVNRDRADNVVDFQLVEQRNREDNDHAADSADEDRLAQLGASGSAVIATRPASAPFSAMVTSTFL